MKFLTLAFALVLCAVYCNCVPASPKKEETSYTTKFDNINIDEILNTKRLLDRYIECMVEDKLCTAEGNELKRYLPDALQTNCRKCNEKQRESAIKVVKFLEKNRPDDWKKLLDKWDPKRTLFDSFKRNNKDLYDQIFVHSS